jgi:hypothetical protein
MRCGRRGKDFKQIHVRNAQYSKTAVNIHAVKLQEYREIIHVFAIVHAGMRELKLCSLVATLTHRFIILTDYNRFMFRFSSIFSRVTRIRPQYALVSAGSCSYSNWDSTLAGKRRQRTHGPNATTNSLPLLNARGNSLQQSLKSSEKSPAFTMNVFVNNNGNSFPPNLSGKPLSSTTKMAVDKNLEYAERLLQSANSYIQHASSFLPAATPNSASAASPQSADVIDLTPEVRSESQPPLSQDGPVASSAQEPLQVTENSQSHGSKLPHIHPYNSAISVPVSADLPETLSAASAVDLARVFQTQQEVHAILTAALGHIRSQRSQAPASTQQSRALPEGIALHAVNPKPKLPSSKASFDDVPNKSSAECQMCGLKLHVDSPRSVDRDPNSPRSLWVSLAEYSGIWGLAIVLYLVAIATFKLCVVILELFFPPPHYPSEDEQK